MTGGLAVLAVTKDKVVYVDASKTKTHRTSPGTSKPRRMLTRQTSMSPKWALEGRLGDLPYLLVVHARTGLQGGQIAAGPAPFSRRTFAALPTSGCRAILRFPQSFEGAMQFGCWRVMEYALP